MVSASERKFTCWKNSVLPLAPSPAMKTTFSASKASGLVPPFASSLQNMQVFVSSLSRVYMIYKNLGSILIVSSVNTRLVSSKICIQFA